jgi:heat shock protein HtpX
MPAPVDAVWHRHRMANRQQTALLIAALLGISALAGHLLFGTTGMLLALAASIASLFIEPQAASALTLRLYRARPIHPLEAPELWALVRELSARAGLPAVPTPHYVPSAIVNAFATGSRRQAAIALTDGLLQALTPRELAGVIAHEVAHIAHGDLRVMGLADYVSRLTSLFALVGQVAILVSLPSLLLHGVEPNWSGLVLLAVSPHLALLAQLGLSRVREFDADQTAARLTGDPRGLACALAKIERISRSWRAWLLPGWGNPEPSWLRTHPATEERIARLLELVPDAASGPRPEPFHGPGLVVVNVPGPVRQAPRWHSGGLWY